VVSAIIIIIIIRFIIVTCARHPADTTAYKSLIHIDVHLIISLHTKNMLPNLLTIKSTTIEDNVELVGGLSVHDDRYIHSFKVASSL